MIRSIKDTTPFVKCQKEAYKDKNEAVRALHRIRNIPGDNLKPVRAYECDECNFWHLTSKEIGFHNNRYELKLDWSKLLNND